ncbi:N-acetylneuraminate synthase [Halorubrum sp. SD626R]|uniref:N-acetylneuraminate synthase n=1 Tax=Halorubrum sp. SD626R TaxID=1419722 RepID=UPI000A468A71|nr:N-acetylneuraminate synthase [Halorubrum sp. SD626R]TKX82269.1 N-acetylneuraminate synthase [Halorubrum sp. SD626R]
MEQSTIGPDEPCYILAEAGVNHNGDIELAKELVNVAVEAGANAVKFQTFNTAQLVTERTETAGYQQRSGNIDQYEMLQSLELQPGEFRELREHCLDCGIEFLSTPYDARSVELLASLGVDRYKIASADLVNKPLLERAAETGSEIIISTGMATPEEIVRAVGWLNEAGAEQVAMLHCVSTYPADFDQLNMRFIQTLDNLFDVPVGYSDHTLGIEAPVVAVSLGATVIEKHFTLDRSMDGPDHEASLEPDELDAMVTAVRNAEESLGSAVKRRTTAERENAAVMRPSLHAAVDIAAGDSLTEENTSVKRPNDGLEPAALELVLGQAVQEHVTAGQPITRDILR